MINERGSRFPARSGDLSSYCFERFSDGLVVAFSVLFLALEEGIHKDIKILENFGCARDSGFTDLTF